MADEYVMTLQISVVADGKRMAVQKVLDALRQVLEQPDQLEHVLREMKEIPSLDFPPGPPWLN